MTPPVPGSGAEGLRELLARSSFIWPDIGPETLRAILELEGRKARRVWQPYKRSDRFRALLARADAPNP